MVDSFHAMNLEVVESWTASEGEIAILQYTAQERKHISSRISHLLSGEFLIKHSCLKTYQQLTFCEQ